MYGKKVIKRDIYQIIIPMILENILQISANLVITAMVGRLLANDISAQGICIRITDTLWCFYKGVAIGATVLIARAYGAGRHQDCRKIAEQTILTEMIIVFIFQVVLYFNGTAFSWIFFKGSPDPLSGRGVYEDYYIRIPVCGDHDGGYSLFPGIRQYKDSYVYCGSYECGQYCLWLLFYLWCLRYSGLGIKWCGYRSFDGTGGWCRYRTVPFI